MAEIFTINIELTSERQKLLKIPELIEVPRGSIVQWNIKILRNTGIHCTARLVV